MEGADKLYFDLPQDYKVQDLQALANDLLKHSKPEIVQVLLRHKVPPSKAKQVAQDAAMAPPEMAVAGSGNVDGAVALALSLTPLIKVMRPLLQPAANRTAKFGYEVAHDIWEMLKKKMLKNNVRLTSKRSSNPATKKKVRGASKKTAGVTSKKKKKK